MPAKRHITKETCFEVANTCYNRNEFRLKDYLSYRLSFESGWLDEWFPHKGKTKILKWTEEVLREEAYKYRTKNSFKWGNWNAYHQARKRPYFDDICAHMTTISKSDEDVLYVLKTDQYFDGLPVYKMGITSRRCGKRRVSELKCHSGFEITIEVWLETPYAREIEKEALMYGKIPEVCEFAGYRELRAMTPQERDSVEKLVKAWGVYY
jgi:hypothetical protein